MRSRLIFLTCSVLPLVILFSACTSSHPTDQINFGIKAARLDLWDEAIFRWKKFLQVEPESSAARNNLAVAYEKKALWEEAKEQYELALKYDPEDKHILSNYKQFMRRYEARKDEIPKKQ
jgi:tetratricopeptide (TPR) repeat protein